MRRRLYGTVGKYGIPRFQLYWRCYFLEISWITQEELPRSNAVTLAVVVIFCKDQSVFCDLQEFLQVSFQTLKHTITRVI